MDGRRRVPRPARVTGCARRVRALAAGLAVTAAAAGCVVEVPLGDGGPTASGPAPTFEETPDLPAQADAPAEAEAQIEERVFALANEARQDEGLSTLEHHDGLQDVARRWSQYLAGQGLDLAHNPVLQEHAPEGWTAVGENVGWLDDGGRLDPEDVATRVHEGWMDSPGHRENLLRPEYTHLGVGVAHDPEHGYYLTQNFATY